MTWMIVERFDSHWCCGICGQEKPQSGKTQYDCQDMYRQRYQHHVWVWWEPYKPNAALSLPSAPGRAS